EETLEIIRGLAPAYEKHHKVKYSEQILEQIVKLSNRYITGRFFPDKAISVMDKCGALYRSGVLRGRKVKPQDVERVVCQAANLPALRADNGDDRKMLADLESNLKKEIYGQDEAVAALVKHIKVAKAGFQDPRKPMLSAFLCGSSGCGKTELARKIAEQLGIAFVKMDMSEYSEEYASSRLIGSAPGYVGYDNPGALTEPVIQTPHCLLLLDEIEKAHRNVFNILLQVLDDGRLTDNKGRVASFKNAIILMTSNAGSRDAAEANDRLGFNLSSTEQSRNRQDIMERTISKIFPPEFRNRLQCSLMMNDLDHQALCAVVRKSIRNASLLLTEPAVELEISDDAVDYLARQAAAEKMGARPVERLVETQVKQKLVDEILFGALSKGGSVKIGLAPDCTGLSLECCKAARQQVTTG
ncbi:MAG: AAA family ATPase, partial [Victivallales bacterium]|nr:AAA family ATPase [Victivallales bacterium]